ncbi:acid protease [Auriscalpium vulgare]|uniref:Acid protease n=1 Tax=Auriscalpium vulgare TaxID=40419 RepID=A0ACB8RXM1_9AGAM|nr:acid protease [Auriscalpium vulgare]
MRFTAASSSMLAALPVLAAAFPAHHHRTPLPAPASGISIPIAKRGAGAPVDPASLARSIARSVAKVHRGFSAYERNTGTPHPLANGSAALQTRATGSDSLAADGQQLWYGAISVGTPKKLFTVDFDTGSSDLFLPGAQCISNCQGHTPYDPTASSTSHDRGTTFSLAYGDGSTVSGKQYSDDVTVAGLTATGQALGVATTYSDGFASDNFPPDGLMGMAFQSISDYDAPPFFQTLIEQGEVDDSVFSFKLAPSDSELFLGGVNPALYSGSFTYVPVTKEGYWETNFDSMSVNGHPIVFERNRDCIIDTGTTLIVGPLAEVALVYTRIPGALPGPQEGIYIYPCSFKKPITMTFGGTSFTISPETFNLGQIEEGSSMCVGGLGYIADPELNFWIIGDVFLQNVYTSFDVGKSRIGFANLA